MLNQQTLLIAIEILIVPLLAWLFWQLGRKQRDLKKYQEQTKRLSGEIISTARGQTAVAMQEAEKTVTGGIEQLTSHLKQSLSLILQNIEPQLAKETRKTLQTLKQLNQDQVEQFGKELIKTTDQNRQSIAENSRQQLDKIQKELDLYKKRQISEIDRQVKKLISQITSDVLNKSISIKDHQKLILDSLEQARKEGLFTT